LKDDVGEEIVTVVEEIHFLHQKIDELIEKNARNEEKLMLVIV